MPVALYPLIKRAIDATAAAVSLLVCGPVLGVAAAAIKLGDGGPVLYRRERVGVDGCRFWLYLLERCGLSKDGILETIRSLLHPVGALG